MPLTDPFTNDGPVPFPLPPTQIAYTWQCKVAVGTNQTLPLSGSPITLDGQELVVGDYYLLLGQTTESENGIRVITGIGHIKVTKPDLGLTRAKIALGTYANKAFTVDQATGAVVQTTPGLATVPNQTFDNTPPGVRT
jgi:hypothetical protein